MKLNSGHRALALAALGATMAFAAPAAADTSAEIRALKARLNKLEAEEAAARRAAKAAAAQQASLAAHPAPVAVAGAPPAPKHWYEKISLRGYTQMRYNATLDATNYNSVYALGDRSVGPRQNFLLRRVRLIFSGDITDHLYIYIQPDFGSAPSGSFSNSATLPSCNATLGVTGSISTQPGAACAYYGLYNSQVGSYNLNAGNFAQLRDAYADISIDEKKEFRFRVGQSKIPYGFTNMQSSQNRLTLDRPDALNTCCKDERDLGIFFYYTPEHMRHLFRDLVKNNLKGSGDYGMFAFGAYNGQGANRAELGKGVHLVARLTYPYVFENGQVVEASIQGYTGRFVPATSAIIPSLGMATNWAGYRPNQYPWNTSPFTGAITPFVNAPGYNNPNNFNYSYFPYSGTVNGVPGFGVTNSNQFWSPNCVNGCNGVKDERVAVTGIIYPQPFGIFAEWNWGRGPVLDPYQLVVKDGKLNGGYVIATYKYDDKEFGLGTFFPYIQWQQYRGGAKTETNAPYNKVNELEVGVEWQPLPEVEFVAAYARMNRTNLAQAPYRQWQGDLLRMQLQWNY
jgi:hypothetical protein